MQRNFSSTLAFNVYREDRPPAYLGNTLDEDDAGQPAVVQVPAHGGWFVRPFDPGLGAEHLPEIVAEVAQHAIPGLSFAGCLRIDDRALEVLALPRLEHLELFNTSAGDGGLRWLAQLPGLQRLSLAGTRVDDAALAAVAAMPGLRELDLGWTEVTDRGLAHLRAHPGLHTLSVRATRVTDRGLEAVATIPQLRSLDLQETSIGDDGVRRLRPLASTLEHLFLGYTAVTTRCVDDVATFGGLRTLMIRVTPLARTHDSELAARLPALAASDGRGLTLVR